MQNRIRATNDEMRMLDACYQEHLRLLGGPLIGIYLYGSRANSHRIGHSSDFDFVFVLRDTVSDEIKDDVLRIYQNINLPLDVAYVTQDQLNVDVVPTPIQFFIKHVGAAKLFRVPDGSMDFPLIRQDLFYNGVRLRGPEINDVVRPVSNDLLKQTLQIVLPHIVERFKYPAPQLCRVLYTHATGQICSKLAAGEWALENANMSWHPIIQDDMHEYLTGDKKGKYSAELLYAFKDHCQKVLDL